METLTKGTRYSPTAPVNFRSGTLFPMIVLYHLVLIPFWASLFLRVRRHLFQLILPKCVRNVGD